MPDRAPSNLNANGTISSCAYLPSYHPEEQELCETERSGGTAFISWLLFQIDCNDSPQPTWCGSPPPKAFLVQAAKEYPKAAAYLETWCKVVRAAAWQSLQDVRRAYPSADAVRIESGRQVFIFDVCVNDFRLLVAIHFNRLIVFTLRFMTHAAYSRGKCKETL